MSLELDAEPQLVHEREADAEARGVETKTRGFWSRSVCDIRKPPRSECGGGEDERRDKQDDSSFADHGGLLGAEGPGWIPGYSGYSARCVP
jgi:hypothetical protein